MSSERGRVIVIFAAVAVVAGGAGFYFFKIYRPNQIKRDAQAEVLGWEARFGAARDCLLGKQPGSSKTSEALAIREMNPDPWDRGRCTPLISKLSRGDAPDTGLPAVEATWLELDQAAIKAAAAFATHVGSSTTLKLDPLPAALDHLDAARAKLRSTAGLDTAAQAGAPLQAGAILPIADGTDPLGELTIDTVPSAHGIVVFGKTSRQLQISLATGAKPQLARVADGVLRAVPDLSWGATVLADEIRIGALDVEGAMPSPTSEKLVDGAVAAIVGTLADGEIVYGNHDQLITGKVKAGAVTLDPPIKIKGGQAALDVDGRAAVIWRDDKQLYGRIIKAGADEPVVELGDESVGSICLTKDRAWVVGGNKLVAFGGGKPLVTRTIDFQRLLGCSPDALLLRTSMIDSKHPVTVCTTEDCKDTTVPTGAPEASALTVVNGKLVALASHGGVLGVWRAGADPVFYGLPEVADPVLAHEWPAMALTDGKVIDVLARGAKGFVVIRIPAT